MQPETLDRFAVRIGRPRRVLECRTCLDFGMIESGNQEDVCPTCEGGIWRERESWEWWVHRQSWFGFRILFHDGRTLPRVYTGRGR